MMKGYKKLKIVDKKIYKGRFVSLFFESPEIVKELKPGNFFMLKTGASSLILPRPFSSARVFEKESIFEINFEIIGKGTEELSKKGIGDFVEILGPLGNSFPYDKFKNILMVAGGRGISPFLYMVKLLEKKNISYTLVYGAKSRDELIFIDYLSDYNIRFVTEDGFFGRKGLVTEHIEKGYEAVFSCGPEKMMHAVFDFYRDSSEEIYFSLEERMGCGTGVCYGCAKRLRIDGKIKMVRICVEGPVFKGEQVFFDEE